MYAPPVSPADAFNVSLSFRPFARNTVLAYELVLRRSDGLRCYDKCIGFFNATDAKDVALACPAITFEDAR